MALTLDDFHPALDRRGNSELVRRIGELDHFRGTWRKMQEIRAERLAQLRQVTTIYSLGGCPRARRRATIGSSRAGLMPVAEIVDVNRDHRGDLLLVALRPW